jgi:cytoskeleton-associated protein 5
VEAILREAKLRIEPNGLNDLMDAMKNGMKDPNKAVVKVFIALLGLLAEAIGAPIKQFTKKCFVPLLNNLSDKQSLVRADVIVAMNKWADAIGPEQVINQLCPLLLVENPETRTEGFKWISEHADAIPACDTKEMVKPLVSCLTDKSKDIRTSAEDIISKVMPITGYQEFLGATKDMKQAVAQTVKPILEKLSKNCGPAQSKLEKSMNKSMDPPPKEEKKVNSFEKAAIEKKKERNPSPPPAKKAAEPPKTASKKDTADDDEVSITP